MLWVDGGWVGGWVEEERQAIGGEGEGVSSSFSSCQIVLSGWVGG